jgi:cytochrome c oxidase accessory protein FixG
MSASTPATDLNQLPEQPVQLFAKQAKIYPRRVWGRYRMLKWVAMVLLLGIYYLTPWLRWDRGPDAPNQAVLIDMPARRAYFFFIEIWPQEVFLLAGLLILAAIGLFAATSIAGRVWCGYACPQTVWTDLFVWVERIVQGDRNARMKLDAAPLSLDKVWKKGATHLIWLVIALFTGGAWVFYFNDAPTLLESIIHFDVSWGVLSWILALTFSTYLMAGYAREQVCTYMCPYSRFQSAMFDKDTLIITYDAERGEPRGKHKANESWDNRGHCIDCDSCVIVCPAGIDIRKGLQYQCISCGLCVDACNTVMDKLDLPRGLIRYDTLANQSGRSAARTSGTGFTPRPHLLRPRTFVYAGVLAMVGGGMLAALLMRAPTELHVLHDRNPQFVLLSDGTIRNSYTVKILNKTHDDLSFGVAVDGLAGASLRHNDTPITRQTRLPVYADSVGQFRIRIDAPKPPEGRQAITLRVIGPSPELSTSEDSIFISAR